MLIKLLGAFDVVAGLILILGVSYSLPMTLLAIFGIILLIKASMGLLQDFPSWVDFIGGCIFLLSIAINVPGIFEVIIGILIIQKGIFSFI